jgi:hypothetical protein
MRRRDFLWLFLLVTGAHAGELVTGVVRAQGEPVAQVIVYLQAAPQPTNAPALILETVAGHFIPRVQIARSGAAVRLRNSDPTLRIVQVDRLAGTNAPVRLITEAMPYAGFDKTVPLESYREPTLLRATAGNAVAYLAVLPHPWAALTDEQGRFALTNTPVGTHRLHLWHETRGTTVRELKIAGGRAGAVEIEWAPLR